MQPLELVPIQPAIGISGTYLPDLEDSRQDLLTDTFKRLRFLAELKDNSRFPFTEEQIKILKMSKQAGENAQICLDWGFIPFCFIASSSSIGPCLPLCNVSQGAQAIIGYTGSCLGNFLAAQLGLMWGGRNTNVSSDKNNDRQNNLATIINEYYVLSYDIIQIYKNPETKDAITKLAQEISIDQIRSSAKVATLTDEEANRIFKTFEGAIHYVCGRPWRNVEIEKLMK